MAMPRSNRHSVTSIEPSPYGRSSRSVKTPELKSTIQKPRINRDFKHDLSDFINFKALANASLFAVLITDSKKRILYVNPAWEKLTGYSFSEVYGKKPKFLESKGSRELIRRGLRELYKKGKTFTSDEVINRRKDGELLHVYTTIFPVVNASRQILYAQILHDITHMKTVQESMAVLNRRISHILDSISDGFIALDLSWKFTYINYRAEKILNTTKEAVYGRNIWSALPILKKTKLPELFQQALDKQEIIIEPVEWFSGRWYRVRLYPSHDGLSVYFYDITAEVESLKIQSDFISVASHEIKIPITSIKAYTYLIRKRLGKRDDRLLSQYVQKLEEQVDHLSNLSQDLLDTKRIQEGKLILHKKAFSFIRLINETVDSMGYLSSRHKMFVKNPRGWRVLADKEKIRQVLSNLLTNAIKYSPDGGAITIDMKKTRKYIIMSVSDQGIGIPHAMQRKIFHRFVRSKNSISHIGGLGLGLYISSEIIKQHGGDIWVESTVGKGSTFYFSLPV